jgi:hypothetical protein
MRPKPGRSREKASCSGQCLRKTLKENPSYIAEAPPLERVRWILKYYRFPRALLNGTDLI